MASSVWADRSPIESEYWDYSDDDTSLEEYHVAPRPTTTQHRQVYGDDTARAMRVKNAIPEASVPRATAEHLRGRQLIIPRVDFDVVQKSTISRKEQYSKDGTRRETVTIKTVYKVRTNPFMESISAMEETCQGTCTHEYNAGWDDRRFQLPGGFSMPNDFNR